MATGINTKSEKLFTVFLAIAAIVFLLLATKHYDIDSIAIRNFKSETLAAATVMAAKTGISNPCSANETLKVFSATVYICDEPADELVYGEIYDFYPAEADGREQIYDFMSKGNKSRADEMLENVYNLERYPASTFATPLTWQEDPYNERYWRFLFYSLRPVRHLIATAEETGSERYYEKTREITESFIDTGMNQPHSWDDAHGVAFRTMMLVNVWWKLRAAGELPSGLSDKILKALEIHGDFLVDPANYEEDYNHAITQSAALLLLSQNFPDLANAGAWKDTSVRRLEISLSSIIDPNGVLVENSPYYHFYVLEKYWQIHEYAKEQDIEFSDNFDETLDRMVHFATYILTPDLSVPLLGASSPRTFLRSGDYREMAEEFEEFNYVLTSGKEGKPPEEKNILFPSSGIALLRSGWGAQRDFKEESQITFDTGPYRTDHSDYDVLTLSLFSHGVPIIRDAGLFTYEEEHPLYNYFHGTRGHNTIMVDGTDQPVGTGETQPIKEAGGLTSISAFHQLYPGVTHSRAVVMVRSDAFLIIDDIYSKDTHAYEQLFHLNEIATITEGDRLRGTISSSTSNVNFVIDQLVGNPSLSVFKEGREPIRGLCATSYENQIPCYELSYRTNDSHSRYITYIQIAKDAEPQYTAAYDERNGVVSIKIGDQQYRVAIQFPADEEIERRFIAIDTTGNNADGSIVTKVKNWFNETF